MLAVFTDFIPDDLAASLMAAPWAWKAVQSAGSLRGSLREETNAVVVSILDDPEQALQVCTSVRSDLATLPVLLHCHPRHAEQIAQSSRLFDDLLIAPICHEELQARLTVLLERRSEMTANSDVIDYGALRINLANYQASIAGRPLDMTYMEYKLLKYFVQHVDSVLTREVLLREVWGYEYYGGARTVDVHVRRLRSKLGDEGAHLIQTVRSVGYAFGHERLTRDVDSSPGLDSPIT